MKISNKNFVVTGAGGGIGLEICKQLVEKGAKVALIDISEDRLNEAETILGKNNVSKHCVDITNQSLVEDISEQIIQTHGNIDGIVNNAGIIQPFVNINELDYKQIDRVMNINFYGTVYITKAFLPHLLSRPIAHVVNISSMGGFIPFPGQTIYSASKAAVKTFTEGLYSELKNTNVGVTVVFPGAVNTNIASNSGVGNVTNAENSNVKMSSPKDAAKSIISAIERNKFRVLIGKDSKMLNFLYRVSPKMAINMIVKKMSGITTK